MKFSSRVLSKMLQQLKETWMCNILSVIIIWKKSCFFEFYYLLDDKEPFHTQCYPQLNTLVCDHERESDEVNENIVVIAKSFAMEIVKLGCSVLPVASGFINHALKRKVRL